jgi:macrolide-specific efflux system membrane fusion protein
MTGIKRKWIFLALALLLAGAGLGVLMQPTADGSKDNPSPEIAEIKTGDIEEIVTSQGKLEPKEYVDVGAQVSGQIKTLAVEIGDTVKTGELIAEIDPEVFMTRVAANEARLKTLQAQKLQQKATLTSARQKLERSQTLMKTNAISREALEDAQTAVKIAEAQLASLEAQIEESESTLEGDRANLSYTKIYAPMDGTVVSQSVREGQTVNASQTAPTIVQIANLGVMTVRAQVAEADIMKLRTGMPSYFTTLGSGGRRWESEVRQILPSPEIINDVVLYNVLVDAKNEDRRLMSGMSTQMFFVVGTAKDVPLISVAALMKAVPQENKGTGEAYQVKVMQGNESADKIIHVGLMDRSHAEVRDGLVAGDRVILPAPPAPAKTEARIPGRMRTPRL